MAPVTLEQALELRQTSDDTFQNVQRPWTWSFSGSVPGGLLMAFAANAAFETVSVGFSIGILQAHFLSGPKAEIPLDLEVQRLSDGGRIAVRAVLLKQSGRNMAHVTCSFVRTSAMGGPSMEHSASRATNTTVDSITLDDLEPARTDLGPWLRYQRLCVEQTGRPGNLSSPALDALTYTSAMQVSPAISRDDSRTHTLGIIALSDYHVLDTVPTVHKVPFGESGIGDTTRTPTSDSFKFLTSLNHSILFHIHDGFRADEICYNEASSSWAGQRRGEIQTRIFSNEGRLIATCKQEGYFVLKEDAPRMKL